ncbi:MAG: Radical domain protein [Parachlamydiales bacterium]|nr:Radical domain protein [Parachlamydiales bacterium]
MDLNIVLVNPNLYGDPCVPGSYRKAKVPSVSLGLAALAAYVESHSNHRVLIIDARIEGLDPMSALDQVKQLNPALVGVSLCSHESTVWSISFLKMVKEWKKSVHTTLGNHFASLFPQMALSQIEHADSIVIGEGEVTFLDLITHLADQKEWTGVTGLAYRGDQSQVIVNPRRNFIADINTLPAPKRSHLKNEGDECELVVEGSRGCAYRCSFCTIGPFYGLQQGPLLRQKSAQSIFKELKILCERYPKLRRVRFVDPEFFVGVSGSTRIRTLVELIQSNLSNLQICIESRASSIIRNVHLLGLLKSAGLVRVNMGIESGSQRILNKMNKCTKVEDNVVATSILREHGIDYSYGFMMITPWALDEDIEQNVCLLEKIGKIELHKFFHELTLIPGTTAFEELQQRVSLSWKGDLHYYTYTTQSPRIERYRKLASTMERRYNEFFKSASFIYESIRSHLLADQRELALVIEKKSDLVFMEIFRFFWQKASFDMQESDYGRLTTRCFELFVPQLEELIKMIDSALAFPVPSHLLPKYATKYQV